MADEMLTLKSKCGTVVEGRNMKAVGQQWLQELMVSEIHILEKSFSSDNVIL